MAGTYRRTIPRLAGSRGREFGARDSGHRGLGQGTMPATGYAGGFVRCSRTSSRFPFTEATPYFFS